MVNLKEQDVKKALPMGEIYDGWTVCVSQHRVRAYTLYTGHNWQQIRKTCLLRKNR